MAAIGAGLPVTEPGGNLVVDIGGGTTDVAVISMFGIVYSGSLRTAGNHMDESITNYVKRKYNLLIGERMAEQIKIEIGSASALEKPVTMEVKGKSLIEGIPKAITVDDEDKHIVEAVKRRAHVIVCFRPTEDVFLLVSYDSPEQKLWREQESGIGFQQPGTVEFIRFRNGNANLGGESLLAVGFWLTSSTDDDRKPHFSGASLVPGDEGTIRIDPDGVHVSHTFRERPVDSVTQYNFSMKSPTDGFAEKFTKTALPDESRVETSGKCLTYK